MIFIAFHFALLHTCIFKLQDAKKLVTSQHAMLKSLVECRIFSIFHCLFYQASSLDNEEINDIACVTTLLL